MILLYRIKMKLTSTLVVISVFIVASVVICRRTPVLKPFPSVFKATVNASGDIQTVYLDLPNKRARIDRVGPSGPEEWYLIYNPPGAQPGSPSSQDYTLLGINSASNYMHSPPPNNCYYQTSSGMEAYDTPFPSTWMFDEKYVVSPWMDQPDDMVYGGEYYVSELGVMADRWDSKTQCDMSGIGMGIIPCLSIMYSQDVNPVPLKDIQAGSSYWKGQYYYEYFTRIYNPFSPSVHDKDFALPSDWPIKCGNGDAGYDINMSDSGWVYSDTTQNFTISLFTPPVQTLGPVKVRFVLKPDFPATCTDCVSFPDSLVFTKDNWNIPVTVPVKYLKDGCSQYVPVASGGGFEWTIQGFYLEFYSCKQYNGGNLCSCPPSK